MSTNSLLVVDDDPKVQQLLSVYFGGLGWSVETCGDAAQALDAAGSERAFDAVICDLHLSGDRQGEGLAVIETVRRRRPRTAVLLFTAADGPLRREALARGADQVISKPASLAALREAALKAMKKP